VHSLLWTLLFQRFDTDPTDQTLSELNSMVGDHYIHKLLALFAAIQIHTLQVEEEIDIVILFAVVLLHMSLLCQE
jgi:hypothetical protein